MGLISRVSSRTYRQGSTPPLELKRKWQLYTPGPEILTPQPSKSLQNYQTVPFPLRIWSQDKCPPASHPTQPMHHFLKPPVVKNSLNCRQSFLISVRPMLPPQNG